MTLLQFLALWANPTNWVKIYSEEDFKTATALVATGIQWSEISVHLKSLLTFNPKYAADLPGCFLPKKQLKSSVGHFVVADDCLLIFLKF